MFGRHPAGLVWGSRFAASPLCLRCRWQPWIGISRCFLLQYPYSFPYPQLSPCPAGGLTFPNKTHPSADPFSQSSNVQQCCTFLWHTRQRLKRYFNLLSIEWRNLSASHVLWMDQSSNLLGFVAQHGYWRVFQEAVWKKAKPEVCLFKHTAAPDTWASGVENERRQEISESRCEIYGLWLT